MVAQAFHVGYWDYIGWVDRFASPAHTARQRELAGRFGLGNGDGAHAPNEYFLVDSVNSKVQGMDGAVRSFVDYLHELAANA